jgi:hypothetical protein
MSPHNATLQASFINMAVDHARRYRYDGYQTDWEPLALPEGGLNRSSTVVAMQAPYLDFLVRLESALRAAGLGHSVSAAGYAGTATIDKGQTYAKAALFRGTSIQLYDMGTYTCDGATFEYVYHSNDPHWLFGWLVLIIGDGTYLPTYLPTCRAWLTAGVATAGGNLGEGYLYQSLYPYLYSWMCMGPYTSMEFNLSICRFQRLLTEC